MGSALRGPAAGLLIACVTLALCEGALRLCVQPTNLGYGLLFGQVLPPLTLVLPADSDTQSNRRIWHVRGVRNPKNITKSDLQGSLREDESLGYTYIESTVSVHGWWHSNNIGASTPIDTMPRVPKGKTRVFVFGESFARGSRIPQTEAWSSILERANPKVEMVNMGVDGFGMGQSLLRYQSIRNKFDGNVVMFLFVPDADLWRDVNTMRSLGEGWWAYDILPRYVINGDGIEAVRGPYPIGTDIYKHDVPTPTQTVRDHLRKYDRFYFPALFESPPVIGRLVLYKVFAKAAGEALKQHVFNTLRWDMDSEGMAVERRIFREAAAMAKEKGERFVLVVLPDPDLVDRLQQTSGPKEEATWNRRLAIFQADGLATIDLLPDMRSLTHEDLDRGFDKSHYGPRANRALAGFLGKKLDALGLLSR